MITGFFLGCILNSRVRNTTSPRQQSMARLVPAFSIMLLLRGAPRGLPVSPLWEDLEAEFHSNLRGRDFLHSRATDGSQYYVSDFNVASGNINGIFFENGFVHICESLYSNLKPNEIQDILVTYKLQGPHGSVIPQTTLFRLSGHQEGPTVSNLFGVKPVKMGSTFYFDLIP